MPASHTSSRSCSQVRGVLLVAGSGKVSSPPQSWTANQSAVNSWRSQSERGKFMAQPITLYGVMGSEEIIFRHQNTRQKSRPASITCRKFVLNSCKLGSNFCVICYIGLHTLNNGITYQKALDNDSTFQNPLILIVFWSSWAVRAFSII